MAERKCALHVHRWGHPWSSYYKVIPLTPSQLKLIYLACEKLDADMLESNQEFENVKQATEAELKEHPVLFFKLSSVSCKDVASDAFGPSFKINSVTRMFRSIVYSFRIMSEIEDDVETDNDTQHPRTKKDDYAIALRAWNDNINPETEFRLLIVDGHLEAVIKPTTGALVTGKDFEIVQDYVQQHAQTFPEQTLAMDVIYVNGSIDFIEFNPLDEELDTFEANLESCAPKLLEALKREATRHWLIN